MSGPSQAPDFGRVAVLLGGRSAEREVSLKSGKAVLEALLRRGVDARGVDPGPDVVHQLRADGIQRVFIALHGRGGEDGQIQGALETAGIPYTGSGVLGSALGMDKYRTKQIWQSCGVPTPPYVLLRGQADLESALALGFPQMVKPVHEGSSIGMTRVDDENQLFDAWKSAAEFDREVLTERWIRGQEYTASILDDRALPLIRLETPRVFYDYEAKYFADSTKYICPCGLGPSEERNLQQLALKAFEAVGAIGWGRVDFFVDAGGDPWFLEVNTVPGMTDHSLVPMAARTQGIDFDELVWRILSSSLLRG